MTRQGSRTVRTRAAHVAMTLLACTSVASAHHGIINFDLNKEVEITGTITQLAFVNPHSWLYLEVLDENGRTQPWKCELRGASVLRRSGWTPELFAPGTRIAITGAPDRFEPRTCYLGTAVLGDGTRVDRYGQISPPVPHVADRPVRLANGHVNLAGDWAAEQRVLTDPRGMSGALLPISVAQELEPGSVPAGAQAFPGTRGSEASLAEDPIGAAWNRPSAMPLTDAGTRAIAGFDPASSDNPRLRCEPTNILFDWSFEMDVNRIVQDEERLTLLYGSMGLERTIHLNMTEHSAGLQPSRAGHSIGRWEEDVLIVETIGFLPGILSADGRVPHSDQLRVVERFSLDPERLVLRRTYMAEDPLYFEGQYSGSDTVHVANIPFQPAPCDDRSFRSDVLSGGGPSWWVIGSATGLMLMAAFIAWRTASQRRSARTGAA